MRSITIDLVAACPVENQVATLARNVLMETIPSLDIIPRIFPKARYICLHRHVMDAVASLLEACRWGYSYLRSSRMLSAITIISRTR
jgi:hypothetical protein